MQIFHCGQQLLLCYCTLLSAQASSHNLEEFTPPSCTLLKLNLKPVSRSKKIIISPLSLCLYIQNVKIYQICLHLPAPHPPSSCLSCPSVTVCYGEASKCCIFRHCLQLIYPKCITEDDCNFSFFFLIFNFQFFHCNISYANI